MTALAKDRGDVKRRRLGDRNFPVAANVVIFSGAMVSLDNTGNLRPARASTTDKVVGVSKARYDNTGGAAGAISAEVESDFAYAMINSSAGDAIALTDIGADCYAVDDQTVALTNGTNTRVKAGVVQNVTADGVWVRFDK
jgi:hypothetical protein